MENQDFTATFVTDKTPQEVYNAINDVRGWWSGEIEGPTTELNDVFTYRYNDIHYSKHQLIELEPGKKIVWLVTGSKLTFVPQTDEWNGTKVVFEIGEKDGKTEVRFTHQGLVPDFQCYEGCSRGWTYYITRSLPDFIATRVRPVEG